ncbi:exonuclease SbcCD subunit D [Eggerthella sp. AM16-19]|uniref:exonuclease SbcCD subunit D n=1 Tax=Eggerthella sp. AM16-19 TaxID=2292042 RepID=UPI000E4B35A8|nr:exonuclease SbcCD subunit D [Eggerthella sp. AM16-19]RHO42598.1 exonuclease SbcCD subunit D [Eggerthella sp. AM16-19]
MKVLHVSDLHIGKRVNGISMLDDQRYILRQILDIAEKRQVSVLLIAGDVYDKASPSAEAVTVFDAFLTDAVAAGLRVLAIPGNHDSAERIAYAQGLLEKQGVCLPPVYAGEVERVELEDEHGPVEFWLLPFLKPGDVRRFFPDEEIGDDYSAALRAVLGACAIDQRKRNVVLSHQLVTACGTAPDRADDEIKLGGMDNVDVSVYDAFDYVALGHVHRPQRVGRDTVRYSGSPLKYSFSEARYGKSVALIELGEKKPGDDVGECVSFELIPLVPLHDVREVRGTLADVLAMGAAASGSLADAGVLAGGADGEAGALGEEGEGAALVDGVHGACNEAAPLAAARDASQDYLHITLSDEHPQLDAMAKIHEVFPNAMMLDYDNVTVLIDRPQTQQLTADPDSMDTLDLFSAFYESQVGNPLDDEQCDFAHKLIAKVEDSAAKGPDGQEEGAQ